VGFALRAPGPYSGPVEPQPFWAEWDDQRLLDLRMCELGLTLEGSGLPERLAELDRELRRTRLAFRPHAWLSDEWFCPDGVPGIAIPFYLAHPRLVKLEQAQMLEAEGSTREWCLRILRHEAGHAFENAYRTRLLPRRRELFGESSAPYPKWYQPRPYSRRFVQHLDAWYAQSHPDEDFAETFAVWLEPGSEWEDRYAGWPALRKLRYVDGLAKVLAGRPPEVTSRRTVTPLHRLQKTLRQHYRQRRRFYGLDHPHFYDRDLRRLFTETHGRHGSAAAFIRRSRPEVRRRVARWTGLYQYTIDRVLHDMIERCEELGLRLRLPEAETRAEFTALLTVQAMNYLASGRHRVAL
jgi:hypothetical protein